ncbi:MAG TPA: cupin domain-containing protein [Polyangiaceae bacterium]|nr:cupin domain-containing protein [Polyangiaceae bacterium]
MSSKPRDAPRWLRLRIDFISSTQKEELTLPTLIATPSRVTAAGSKPKLIDEFVGSVNNRETRLSVARMQAPSGWQEPGQRPEFDEYTLVLEGTLLVESEGASLEVNAGQAVHARAGEWVRYSTPGAEGARYIAICLPAFSPDTVHRDP